jgi:hypothetical protein
LQRFVGETSSGNGGRGDFEPPLDKEEARKRACRDERLMTTPYLTPYQLSAAVRFAEQ